MTSKLAIIGPSTRKDADIDYTFAQVSFVDEKVDFSGNCGNISSGVAPFAIDEGMIRAVEPVTTVRIHQVNTDSIIIASVPVIDGKAAVEGDYEIAGVAGTGAKITLDFSDGQGAITGKLLPTGNSRDMIDVDGVGRVEVSIVDVANPLVFIAAETLGLKGTETPDEIENDKGLMETIEKIRGTAAWKIGLADSPDLALSQSAYIPFFAIVSKSAAYPCFGKDKVIKAEEVDLVSRLLFMQRMHKTYPGSGTVCTCAAARIPGTIVYDLLSDEAKSRDILKIGHPAGVIETEGAVKEVNGKLNIAYVSIARTSRCIMEGIVYVKNSLLED